jgi:hypothetical protein
MPFPLLVRLLGIFFIAINSPVYFDVRLQGSGLVGLFASVRSDPLFWILLYFDFATLASIFLLQVIHPRRWRSRLVFDQTTISLVPSIFLRQLGDPTLTAPVPAGTKEILICLGSQDTRSPYDSRPYRKGFRVLVRSSESRDRELKIDTGFGLGARQAKLLREGIAASTGLPVQFVQRKIESGVAREIPWTPGDRS